MEKRNYVKPILSGEEFIPQNYIAACGDGGTVYKFECNAGGGAEGGVWQESNGIDGLQTSGYWDRENYKWIEADHQISRSASSFHACINDTDTEGIHEASSTDVFITGCYFLAASNYNDPSQAIPVTVWRGANGNNVHCTTALEQSSWEIAKS